MKRKLFSTFLMILLAIPAFAYDYEENGVSYTINNLRESASVVSYSNSVGKEVVIPEEIVVNGIRYSVTGIGHSAFSGCTSLTSITIPNSVTSIGYLAFSGCTSLTSITIPNSVTIIDDHTFSDCTSLTSITIPNSVTYIGESSFSGCSSLMSITVDAGNTTYDSRDNCNAIIETASNTLIAGCKNTIIPNSVTSIGYLAFHFCQSLTSITIPNSVTYIGESSFSGCTGLTSITIPNSVTSIGELAFYNCNRLQTIHCLNPTPPTCYSKSTFIANRDSVRDPYDIYTYAILHVPMGSGEAYASAYEWRYFNKIKEDMESDGKVYYANLTVKQGTTGYTRQAIKAAETYTIYIGSLGEYKVNSVTFNGVDVTDQVVNGNYTTPEIKGESVLSIAYEVSTEINPMRLGQVKVTGNDGRINISQIDEPADVMVYSVEGKLIDSVPSAFGSVSIQASREQVYIVKVGARTYKIAL